MSVNYFVSNYYSNLNSVLNYKINTLKNLLSKLINIMTILYIYIVSLISNHITANPKLKLYYQQLTCSLMTNISRFENYLKLIKAEAQGYTFSNIKNRIEKSRLFSRIERLCRRCCVGYYTNCL